MNVQIEESWKKALTPEFSKDYFIQLTDFVRKEYHETTVYPPGKLIFNAFNLCPFDKVKKPVPQSGNLTRWAEQGVLLLNATLTVRAHQAGSHQRRGWEEFTDAVIRKLAEEKNNLVFILWGAYAQKKGAFIDRNKHLVLTSVHPSPLSAHSGFFGNHHFSLANDYLVKNGKTAIDW